MSRIVDDFHERAGAELIVFLFSLLGLFFIGFDAVGALLFLEQLEVVACNVAGRQGLLDRLGNVDGFEAYGIVALVVGPVVGKRG